MPWMYLFPAGGTNAVDVPAPGQSVGAFCMLRRMGLDPLKHGAGSPAAINPTAASAKALGSNRKPEPQAQDGPGWAARMQAGSPCLLPTPPRVGAAACLCLLCTCILSCCQA